MGLGDRNAIIAQTGLTQEKNAVPVWMTQKSWMTTTVQNRSLKSARTKTESRRSVFRSASLQHILLSNPGRHCGVGGETWSMPVPHGINFLASSALKLGKADSFPFICIESGLPFAKLLPFSIGSDFPKDKHIFSCQDHLQGKFYTFFFLGASET